VTARLSLSDVTGCTLVRFERADGLTYNEDPRINHGGIDFRALPPDAIGEHVEAYLYAVLRLDRARFVFDLPASMRGHASMGEREGFVFNRGADGKATGRPVGKVIFLNRDRRFCEGDPESRADFEAMR